MFNQEMLDVDEIKKMISSHMLADGMPLILDLKRSKGIRMYDLVTKK